MKKRLAAVGLIICLIGCLAPACLAAEGEEAVEATRNPWTTAAVALAAAATLAGCALATGFAQSRIGAAGCATIAERPETTGTVLLLLALPETMVILGFVVAVIMLFVL